METTQTVLSKYEAYKDSGEDWLRKIPEHWEYKRMKYLFFDYSKKGLPNEELLSVTQDQGVVPRTWVENRMVMPNGSLETFKFIAKGDFAISLRSFEGGLEYCHHNGIISPAYTVLKRRIKLEEFYYRYLFKSKSFISELQTSIVGIREGKNISYQELCYSFLPIPPLPEQSAIAAFLDEKTAKIDQAIAQKERLIELLKERKQILIQELVTGKKVWDEATQSWVKPMETVDSGVEWIGEIPKGWEVKKIKFLLDELNIRSETGNEELLSLSKYLGVIPKSNLEERAGGAESLVGYKVVKVKCLVVNKMQAVNGLIAVSKIEGITSPDYSVYYSKNEQIVNIDYICQLILQPEYLAEFKKRVTGVMEGFIRLYTDDFYDVKIVVPPIIQQIQIIKFIDLMSLKIEQSIGIQRSQITQLKEYKAVLIDNAVTGKIKVPGV